MVWEVDGMVWEGDGMGWEVIIFAPTRGIYFFLSYIIFFSYMAMILATYQKHYSNCILELHILLT